MSPIETLSLKLHLLFKSCLPTFVWVHLIAKRRPISLVICDRKRMINNWKLCKRTTPVAGAAAVAAVQKVPRDSHTPHVPSRLHAYLHTKCYFYTMDPGRDRNRDVLRIKYWSHRMPPFYSIRCCGVGFCGRRSRRPYTLGIVPVTCFLQATVIFCRGRSDLRPFVVSPLLESMREEAKRTYLTNKKLLVVF